MLAAIPFVIVADIRTGSTLLSSTLDLHPQVRCYGELLHPQDLPDNRPPGPPRQSATGEALVRRALDPMGKRAAGFRAMVFLPMPETPQWAGAWPFLRELPGLHVIHLRREDRLAQYLSARVAEETGSYHPSPGEPVLRPENRPRVRVDPGEFRAWCAERDALVELRRRELAGKPSLELTYEELTGRWAETMRRVLRFLEVGALALQPAKRKQEKRRVEQIVRNPDELRAAGLLA